MRTRVKKCDRIAVEPYVVEKRWVKVSFHISQTVRHRMEPEFKHYAHNISREVVYLTTAVRNEMEWGKKRGSHVFRQSILDKLKTSPSMPRHLRFHPAIPGQKLVSETISMEELDWENTKIAAAALDVSPVEFLQEAMFQYGLRIAERNREAKS